MRRGVLAVLLAVLLTACSHALAGPSPSVVKQAIAIHVRQVQQELNQQLRLPSDVPPQFAIDHVEVTQQDPLTIQELPAFHVQGTYDLTVQLPSHPVTQRGNPFDLYLQTEAEGKVWRWARQVGNPKTGFTWVTQLIPGTP